MQARAGTARCGRCHDLRVEIVAGRERAEGALCTACMAPCPGCRGEGERLITDDAGYRVLVACPHCSAATHLAALYSEIGIPPRYGASRVGTYRGLAGTQGQVRDFVRAYLERFEAEDRGVLLIGDPGVGKTHLLTAILRFLTLAHRLPCRYIEFGALLSNIKMGYTAGRTDEQIIAPLVAVPVLAIDELGKGKGSDWELSIIDALITRRYNHRRLLFVATNYHLRDPIDPGKSTRRQIAGSRATAGSHVAGRTSRERVAGARARLVENLEERVGGRVTSRLAEMCHVQLLEGPDYRKSGYL